MYATDLQKHWENVYETKDTTRVGWFQQKPIVSLNFFEYLEIPKSAKILDAGGGDSLLVDYLLEMGYQNITVLDISAAAIHNAQIRLGSLADEVQWIVDDLSKCQLDEKYDVWHDRAAFHFLRESEELQHYLNLVRRAVKSGGFLIIGTFSKTGPTNCSGLPVTQYSTEELIDFFSNYFEPIKCLNSDHITPGGVEQNYSFCAFRRK
ncbi:MAG: class I SAM-dependent methyltransferase [Algoriphagus sp.]|nr:class I SAM-dependent methyltransferase [Algoriphagus sp.]